MRIYESNELKKVQCNMCGKELQVEKGIVREGVLHAEYDWGYFSKKDGEKHIFDICESCYEKMINEFAIKIEIKENLELL